MELEKINSENEEKNTDYENTKRVVINNFANATNIKEIGFGAHSKVYKFDSNGKEYVIKSSKIDDKWINTQEQAKSIIKKISEKYNGKIKLPNSRILNENYIVEEYLGEEFNDEVFSKLDKDKVTNLQKEFADFLKYMHEDFSKIEIRESTKKDIVKDLNLNEDLALFKDYLPDKTRCELEESINNFKEYAKENEYHCQVHADIRAQNVLYNENKNELSLIDFETAKIGDLYSDFCPKNSFGISYEFFNGVVDEYNKIANVKINKHKLADMHKVLTLMEYARCNQGTSKENLEEVSLYLIGKIENINKIKYERESQFFDDDVAEKYKNMIKEKDKVLLTKQELLKEREKKQNIKGG